MQSESRDRRYEALAEKWLNGTITPAEEKEFANWYNDKTDEPLKVPAEFAVSEEAHRQRILQNIQGLRFKELKPIPIQRRWITRISAAAVVLIFLSIGAYRWLNKPGNEGVASIHGNQLQTQLAPGSTKAVLTLADGSKIILDSAANGTLTQQGNTKIIKLDNGQLAYSATGSSSLAGGEKMSPAGHAGVGYNTISTPRGGQYQIVLADGSKIWLNSSSSLKFPTRFLGNERKVELTGEGYFEIAHIATKSFKVSVNGMEVQVLGTHFNINAYNDEESIKTTLLQGSVKISLSSHVSASPQVMLKPGQQAILSTGEDHNPLIAPGSGIRVVDADVDEVVAWKNGEFQFEGADIQTIMRQIARWYDVEVVYEGKVLQHFNGTIPRNVEASKVFTMLELTKAVHFEIDGKKVIVKP